MGKLNRNMVACELKENEGKIEERRGVEGKGRRGE
jgi:hypothetical protein